MNETIETIAFEIGMVLLATASLVPIWMPEWLPLQDLPQHLAAIRVLSDFYHPDLNFTEFYRLTPFQTQYLGYYGSVWLIAWIFEVETANRLFLSICLFGTPYAMRYLLVQLNRWEGLTFFVFLLLHNTFLLLGFINFIAAIPLMLLGLGLAVRLRRGFTVAHAVALGGASAACFFMHVVPFAFLAVGAGLLGLGDSWRETVRRWLPVLPAGIISIVWTVYSPAGSSTTEAVEGGKGYRIWSKAFRKLPDWLTNVHLEPADVRVLIAYGIVMVAVVVLGARVCVRASEEESSHWFPSVQRVGVLAPLALLGYFALPVSYDWIWPIAPRFALLGVFLLIPALPVPKKVPRVIAMALLAAISLNHFYHVGKHFRAYSREEVGELQGALDAIPKGKRVAGLIFDRGSSHVRFSPFIHVVAYYQAQKGGAVMFTFADFPQSPFRFRSKRRPPKVRPRWEWTPHRVDPRESLGWYDYVLIRGGPGQIRHQEETYDRIYESTHWSVWKRVDTGK